MKPGRVVIADDHAVLRVGLRSFLEDQTRPPLDVVGEASSGEEALALVDSLQPDLLVLDLSMPGMGGLETTIELRKRGSKVRVLVLTQHAEAILLRRVMEAGANGYLLKSARGDELLTAIRAVLTVGTYVDPTLAEAGAQAEDGPDESQEEAFARLTPRETQVLKLVAEGYSNKRIAELLGLSVKTVMTHRFNLTDKLGTRHPAKLARLAMGVGLLPLPRRGEDA